MWPTELAPPTPSIIVITGTPGGGTTSEGGSDELVSQMLEEALDTVGEEEKITKDRSK